MDMQALFDGAPLEAEAAPVETEKKPAGNTRNQEMVELFKKSLNEDPEFKEKVSSSSADLEVVNTLSYGINGGLIPDKSKPKTPGKDGKLRWKPIVVPEIVGYRVKNVGKQPIEYKVCVCKANAEGIYEVTEVSKVLKPGQTADLPRKYFTMLAYRPEYSFILANGKVSMSKKASNMEEMLNKVYFTFNEAGKGVHDDGVKVSISKQEGDKTVLLPEYVETFGFLNNPSEKASREKKTSGGKKYSTQELAANYIRRMVEGGLNK